VRYFIGRKRKATTRATIKGIIITTIRTNHQKRRESKM
jgi:hypothetical protein